MFAAAKSLLPEQIGNVTFTVWNIERREVDHKNIPWKIPYLLNVSDEWISTGPKEIFA